MVLTYQIKSRKNEKQIFAVVTNRMDIKELANAYLHPNLTSPLLV